MRFSQLSFPSGMTSTESASYKSYGTRDLQKVEESHKLLHFKHAPWILAQMRVEVTIAQTRRKVNDDLRAVDDVSSSAFCAEDCSDLKQAIT